eukprot:COSAG05_NODE_1363_length_5081_cov_1.577479_5_plen_139_part_00
MRTLRIICKRTRTYRTFVHSYLMDNECWVYFCCVGVGSTAAGSTAAQPGAGDARSRPAKRPRGAHDPDARSAEVARASADVACASADVAPSADAAAAGAQPAARGGTGAAHLVVCAVRLQVTASKTPYNPSRAQCMGS